MKNYLLILLVLFSSCAKSLNEKDVFIDFEKKVSSGEQIQIYYDSIKEYDNVEASLVKGDDTVIEKYNSQPFGNYFIINRFLNRHPESNESLYLSLSFLGKNNITRKVPISIEPSIIVESLCGNNTRCDMLTGNVLANIKNKLSVRFYKFSPVKIEYRFVTPSNSYILKNEYTSPVEKDWVENIIFESVKEEYSSYLAKIVIVAYDIENNLIETAIPLRVVRPLEVKHFGQHELAQVFEPVPVTGCIPGSVGNNVQYSESESETRQNSVSIGINQTWSNSNSITNSNSISEGISVGETESTVLSSSLSESETQSEGFNSSSSESNSNNLQFSTSDGENWSWSLGESSSQTEGQTESENSNTSVNGSVTVGVSGEGSLPFLAKASGKVETSAGIQRGWGTGTSSSNSTTDSNSRGYSTGGSSQNGRTYGSVQNATESHSLSGTYVLSSSTSNSITESSSLSSNRIWNMSESISSGNVVTEANSENLTQTIVSSSSSSTTFSYNAYIPRGRYGVFFRQTSRYTKLSEIISYTLNGEPVHSGYIMMNTWAWAPELSIANTCEEAMLNNLPEQVCIIPPCGE